MSDQAESAPEPQFATPADVRVALESLTEADAVRLKRFAKIRVAKLGPLRQRTKGAELLNEALKRVLSGDRRWQPAKVNFAGFLMGAMWSISSNLARDYKQSGESLFSEASLESKDGTEYNPTDRAASGLPDPERMAEMRQQIAHIGEALQEDEEAFAVLDEWRHGASGPEIRAEYAFTETHYETIVRRIRRKARRLEG